MTSLASLASVVMSCAGPLHVESGGKTVKRVAVENPLSRGGHTQIAVFGAFF